MAPRKYSRGPFSISKAGLGLSDSFVGAGTFAGAAVDALVGVDYIGAFALGDSAHRAYIGAGAAGDTKVGIDFSRHSCYNLIVVVFRIANVGIIFDFKKNSS